MRTLVLDSAFSGERIAFEDTWEDAAIIYYGDVRIRASGLYPAILSHGGLNIVGNGGRLFVDAEAGSAIVAWEGMSISGMANVVARRTASDAAQILRGDVVASHRGLRLWGDASLAVYTSEENVVGLYIPWGSLIVNTSGTLCIKTTSLNLAALLVLPTGGIYIENGIVNIYNSSGGERWRGRLVPWDAVIGKACTCEDVSEDGEETGYGEDGEASDEDDASYGDETPEYEDGSDTEEGGGEDIGGGTDDEEHPDDYVPGDNLPGGDEPQPDYEGEGAHPDADSYPDPGIPDDEGLATDPDNDKAEEDAGTPEGGGSPDAENPPDVYMPGRNDTIVGETFRERERRPATGSWRPEVTAEQSQGGQVHQSVEASGGPQRAELRQLIQVIETGGCIRLYNSGVAVTLMAEHLREKPLEGAQSIEIAVEHKEHSELEALGLFGASGNIGPPIAIVEIALQTDTGEVLVLYRDINIYVSLEHPGTPSVIHIDEAGRVAVLRGSTQNDTNFFEFRSSVLGIFAILANQSEMTVVELWVGSGAYSVNGYLRYADTKPIIMEGRTFVPLRVVSEALGADVAWNEEYQLVVISGWGRDLRIVIGLAEPGMDLPPTLVNGRTMVPLRYVAERMGASVVWGIDTQTVEIYHVVYSFYKL